MKIAAIIQARVGSTRFPGKVFADLSGKPFIWHIINRLKFSGKIDEIILATTLNPLDDELENWANFEGVKCFRGSENNVLERFYFASKKFEVDIIVRITADDPFKDPLIIDTVINILLNNNLDFACNNYPPSFPEGLDTEVFTFKSLEKAYSESDDDFEKEHVTQYFYRHPEFFIQNNYSNNENLSHFRWTVDTIEDYNFVKVIYSNLYESGKIFLMNDILEYINKNPVVLSLNSEVERSTMYKEIK